jgi:transcriptional regulator with XRE-family HTH domain
MSERGVTAYKLAQSTGISSGNITDWKNGKASPSYGALVKIANYFNVSVEYLECKTDDPTPAAAPAGDEKIEILARAARKMTDEEKVKLIEMAKVMFRKAFDE